MNILKKLSINGTIYKIGKDVDISSLMRIATTIPSAPDKNTVSYDGYTFVPGDIVRVEDVNSETGYVFYILHKVVDGLAYWAKLETSVIIPPETVTINFTSNLATINDLIGVATATLEYNEVTESKVFEGSSLTFEIPDGIAYSITFSDVPGYKTPNKYTRTAVSNASPSTNAEYNTEVVTITVNTDDNTSVVGQVLTVNGTEYTLTADNNPLTVKIPWVGYSISANSKDTYDTPEAVTIAAAQLRPTRSVTMTYTAISELGVRIIDKEGKTYSVDEWNTANNAKALGVQIGAEYEDANGLTKIHKFIMYGYYAGGKTTGKANRSYANADYDATTEVSSLTTYETLLSALVESVWGDYNTNKLKTHFGTTYDISKESEYAVDKIYYGDTYNAFGFLETFDPDGKGRTWYIPTAREWAMVHNADNTGLVSEALSKIGGYNTGDGDIFDWSSTQTIFSTQPKRDADGNLVRDPNTNQIIYENIYGFFAFNELGGYSDKKHPHDPIYLVVVPFASLD